MLKKFSAILLGSMILASTTSADPIHTPEGNAPLVRWTVVTAKDDSIDEILELEEKLVTPAKDLEPGTYYLYSGVDESNPNTMRTLEIYENSDAYRLHITSKNFREYQAKRLPMVEDVQSLEVIPIVLEQKKSGTGLVVCMHRYEISPESLSDYQDLVTAEAERSVRDEDGVVGIYVTAEIDKPNVIHTMEIFRNTLARNKYLKSKAYKNFQSQLAPMIQSQTDIENLPTHIDMTDKGMKTGRDFLFNPFG